MADTPHGYKLNHRLDGGGREIQGTFVACDHYGPVRRIRIRRALRKGSYRRALELTITNPEDFALDEWADDMYRAVLGQLVEHLGL